MEQGQAMFKGHLHAEAGAMGIAESIPCIPDSPQTGQFLLCAEKTAVDAALIADAPRQATERLDKDRWLRGAAVS